MAIGNKGDSPALALVRHVWERNHTDSWQRLNGSMYAAVNLAIGAGLRFDADDFAVICKEFRGGYWFGNDGVEMYGEGFYSRAVEVGNSSACQSFEAWRERPPFIFGGKRLHLRAEFDWQGLKVKVTSFSKDSATIGACSYKRVPTGSGTWKYEKEKVDRRFRISIDELRAAERDRRKAEEAKREAAMSPEEKKRRDDIAQAKKREEKYRRIITRAVGAAKRAASSTRLSARAANPFTAARSCGRSRRANVPDSGTG